MSASEYKGRPLTPQERAARREEQRVSYERFNEGLRLRERERYVKVIEAALRAGDPGGVLSPHGHAEIAYDALLADGVVFARMGTLDEGGGEGRSEHG